MARSYTRQANILKKQQSTCRSRALARWRRVLLYDGPIYWNPAETQQASLILPN